MILHFISPCFAPDENPLDDTKSVTKVKVSNSPKKQQMPDAKRRHEFSPAPESARHRLKHDVGVKSAEESEVHVAVLVGIAAVGAVICCVANPIAALVILTFCGFQLVYTHVWVIATILAICTNSLEWAGVLAAMGTAITIPWYALLILRWKDDTVGRAICGWGSWIVEDIFGYTWPYDLGSVPGLLRVGYHMVDLAVHFWPTPWLLQRFKVTAFDCFVAFIVSRAWSTSASAIHLSVDWRSLRRSPRRLRVCAQSQAITPFLVDGVVNDIYGLHPKLPPASLRFLYSIEALTLVTVAVVVSLSTLVIPPTRLVEASMISCTIVGVICMLAGIQKVKVAVTKAQ